MSAYAFWHFTCSHGRRAIGQTGIVLPQPGLAPMKLAWFTDMPHPLREQVGLTSYLLSCDRMGYRYRVTSARDIKAWADADVPDDLRSMLDGAPGARPEHWFVAEKAVPVRLDPWWPHRGGL